MSETRAALRAPTPIDLLAYVSSLVTAIELDPKPAAPGDRIGQNLPDFVMSFAEMPVAETTALLRVIGILAADPHVRSRAREASAGRRHPLPMWLAHLDTARVTGAVEGYSDLGDGENLMIEVRWEGGAAITVMLYIDHNIAPVALKDSWLAPDSLDDVESLLRAQPDVQAGRIKLRPINGADARARLEQAIDGYHDVAGLVQSDGLPGSLPILRWVCSLMPPGGSGYVVQPTMVIDRARVEREFARSTYGQDWRHDVGDGKVEQLDRPVRHLFAALLEFGQEHSPADPLRWSLVSVEMFLRLWAPLNLPLRDDDRRDLVDLLGDVIQFLHRRADLPMQDTIEALDSIREFAPYYLRDSPIAKMADLRDYLAELVGGHDALDELDDEPLPDEPLDLGEVAADLHDQARTVAALMDQCCDEMFGVELRTACRRLLVRAMAGDPSVFRRRAAAKNTAWAIVWMLARLNNLLSGPGQPQSQNLAQWFGKESGGPSTRVQSIAGAVLGRDHRGRFSTPPPLGMPDLLVAQMRTSVIAIVAGMESHLEDHDDL